MASALRVDVAHCVRQGPNDPNRPARGAGRAQKRQSLQEHDDNADAGHEPGNHRIRREGDEAADAHHAQQDLYEAGHDNDGEGFGKGVGVGGDDNRHGHGHGARGTRDLRLRSAENRREEADSNCPVNAGKRSQTGRHAEG